MVIPRVWESTVATEGMFGNLNPLGDGPGRSLADHGARVPEVLPAAELEGFLTGLIIAMPLEPVLGAAVGDDVEEAQELAMDPTRGADDTRQEGVGDTRPRGVGLPVAVHLGARCGLEELVGLGMPESSVQTDIGHVIAAKLVNEGDINDEVGVTADVGALDEQITLSGLTILFLHGRDVAPFRREAGLVAEDLDRVEHGLVSRLGAASVFLAGVHMIPVLVDDVTTASAHSPLLP